MTEKTDRESETLLSATETLRTLTVSRKTDSQHSWRAAGPGFYMKLKGLGPPICPGQRLSPSMWYLMIQSKHRKDVRRHLNLLKIPKITSASFVTFTDSITRLWKEPPLYCLPWTNKSWIYIKAKSRRSWSSGPQLIFVFFCCLLLFVAIGSCIPITAFAI